LVLCRVWKLLPTLDTQDVDVTIPTAQREVDDIVDDGIDRAQRVIAVRAQGYASEANDAALQLGHRRLA
jgi:hypothetical protein